MISTITSVQNERIKYVRSLARRRTRQREGRFLIEGTRLVDEAVRAGIEPALVLYTEIWATGTGAQRLLPALSQAKGGAWPVTDSVLAACADTQTPQGVLAVVPLVQLRPRAGLAVILDQLRDPGNLGTVLRSAEAAGAGQVLLAPGTVDVYSPKVVRGGMGAHFRLPVAHLDWPAIEERVAGKVVWLADADGDVVYHDVDWRRPSAIIVGGETEGTSEEATALATGQIRIPMAEGADSLNAAMAATVMLFEAARQRQR